MSRLESNEAARPLSTSEYFMWLLDRIAATNLAVIAEIEGALDPAGLGEALRAVCGRHPALRRTIVVEGGKTWLKPAAEPTFPVETCEYGGAGWQSVVAHHLDLPLNAGQAPLARCILMNSAPGSHTMVLVLHHAIADGLAGMALTREVLALATGSAPPVDKGYAEALPSLERLYPARHRGFRGAARALGSVIAQCADRLVAGPLRAVPGFRTVVSSERRSHIIPLTFSRQLTEAIVRWCRREGTTVQGALGSALLAAAAGESPRRGRRSFALVSPVNLREALSPAIPPGRIGTFIGMATTLHRWGAGTTFRETARAYKAALTRCIERGDPFVNWQLLAAARLFPPDCRGGMRMNRLMYLSPPGTMITNVGRVPAVQTAAGVRIRSVSFAISPNARNAAAVCAATYDGCLRVNFTFSAPGLQPAAGQRIAGRLRKVLERAGGSEGW